MFKVVLAGTAVCLSKKPLERQHYCLSACFTAASKSIL